MPAAWRRAAAAGTRSCYKYGLYRPRPTAMKYLPKPIAEINLWAGGSYLSSAVGLAGTQIRARSIDDPKLWLGAGAPGQLDGAEGPPRPAGEVQSLSRAHG